MHNAYHTYIPIDDADVLLCNSAGPAVIANPATAPNRTDTARTAHTGRTAWRQRQYTSWCDFSSWTRFPDNGRHYELCHFSLFVCVLGLILGCVVLLHHLFWPVLQRPLYAFQRYEVIKRKPLLWTIGISLLLLTPPQWSWRLVLEALGKL
jgi:hypothetical protein